MYYLQCNISCGIVYRRPPQKLPKSTVIPAIDPTCAMCNRDPETISTNCWNAPSQPRFGLIQVWPHSAQQGRALEIVLRAGFSLSSQWALESSQLLGVYGRQYARRSSQLSLPELQLSFTEEALLQPSIPATPQASHPPPPHQPTAPSASSSTAHTRNSSSSATHTATAAAATATTAAAAAGNCSGNNTAATTAAATCSNSNTAVSAAVAAALLLLQQLLVLRLQERQQQALLPSALPQPPLSRKHYLHITWRA